MRYEYFPFFRVVPTIDYLVAVIDVVTVVVVVAARKKKPFFSKVVEYLETTVMYYKMQINPSSTLDSFLLHLPVAVVVVAVVVKVVEIKEKTWRILTILIA